MISGVETLAKYRNTSTPLLVLDLEPISQVGISFTHYHPERLAHPTRVRTSYKEI